MQDESEEMFEFRYINKHWVLSNSATVRSLTGDIFFWSKYNLHLIFFFTNVFILNGFRFLVKKIYLFVFSGLETGSLLSSVTTFLNIAFH